MCDVAMRSVCVCVCMCVWVCACVCMCVVNIHTFILCIEAALSMWC